MEDFEIVVLQLLMPSGRPASQLPGGLPVCEVLVVHFDYEGFFGPYEVQPPMFDRLEHSKELEIVGIVVLFSGGERGQVVRNGVPLPWGDSFSSPILG